MSATRLDADSSEDESAAVRPNRVQLQEEDSSDSSVGRPEDMVHGDSSADEGSTKRRQTAALNADSSDEEIRITPEERFNV